MNNKPQKKKLISTKTKIIIFAVLAITLFIFAMYLGMRFQIFLTSFIFRSYFGIVKFLFWTALIIGLILVLYCLYLVRKFKKRHPKDHDE